MKAGILTLIGDVCKVFMAMVIVWLIFRNRYPDSVKVLELYAGVGCILGHDFPAYMKFKGGKGIACTGGLLIGFCPLAVPISLGIFILVVAITRYVSLGSILGVISLEIQIIVFGQMGHAFRTGAVSDGGVYCIRFCGGTGNHFTSCQHRKTS